MTLAEAAEALAIPLAAADALVAAGYLAAVDRGTEDLFVSIADLKGFVARNAVSADELSLVDSHNDASGGDEPGTMLVALHDRSREMAERALEIFQASSRAAGDWGEQECRRFVNQASKRFEAILALSTHDEIVDQALIGDLREVGSQAAWSGSSLVEILAVLRISRDVMVHASVELAERRKGAWGSELSVLFSRVLPAMDCLVDSLSSGYWEATVETMTEARERYQNLVDHGPDGFYEVDIDGRLVFASSFFTRMLGSTYDDLIDRPLGEALVVDESAGVSQARVIERLMRDSGEESDELCVPIRGHDGRSRTVLIRTFIRRRDHEVTGYQGWAREVTHQADLDRSRRELLGLIADDLRGPLEMVSNLARAMETFSVHDEHLDERLRQARASLQAQADRAGRLVDDLDDVTTLAADSLSFATGTVMIAPLVQAVVADSEQPADIEVSLDPHSTVLGDAWRLEQVLVSLLDNAFAHGAGPIRIVGIRHEREVELVVSDEGVGVPPMAVPTLFARPGSPLQRTKVASYGRRGGLRLFLVKGLVEAMGGRIWYESQEGGGSSFHVLLRSD